MYLKTLHMRYFTSGLLKINHLALNQLFHVHSRIIFSFKPIALVQFKCETIYVQGGYIRLLFDPIKFIVVHCEISNRLATSATLAAYLCNYLMTFWQIYFVLALQFIFISPQIQHIQPNLYQKK